MVKAGVLFERGELVLRPTSSRWSNVLDSGALSVPPELRVPGHF
jgi:hypothetical protein